MQRQALVHEGVIGRQEIEHAAVLDQDAADEHVELGAKGVAQAVVEVREDGRIRIDLVERAQLQPLEREGRDQRARALHRQEPARLHVQHLGVEKRPLLGHAQQLVVRQAAGQEERETRRQFERRDAMDRARGDAGGGTFGTVEELGAGQIAGSASRMPASKSAPSRPRAKNCSGAARSCSVTGRRYARRASVDKMRRAHGFPPPPPKAYTPARAAGSACCPGSRS
jgi:hypothetical protein